MSARPVPAAARSAEEPCAGHRIRIGAGAQQRGHDIAVPRFGRKVERGTSVAISEARVGSGAEQHGDDTGPSGARGDVQRREAVAGKRIRSGACVEQSGDDVGMAFAGGEVKRGNASIIGAAGVDAGFEKGGGHDRVAVRCDPAQQGIPVRARLQESNDDTRVAPPGRPVQSGVPRSVGGRRIGTGVQKDPNGLNVSGLGRRPAATVRAARHACPTGGGRPGSGGCRCCRHALPSPRGTVR